MLPPKAQDHAELYVPTALDPTATGSEKEMQRGVEEPPENRAKGDTDDHNDVKSGTTSESTDADPTNTNGQSEAKNDAARLGEYLKALGQREASGKYDTKNSMGYWGKWQIGPAALTDTGYMKDGKWTGKDGIHSEEEFLHSPKTQEKAIRNFVDIRWQNAKGEGLGQYIGKNINWIEITKSGIIAAVHLKGAHGAKPFFATNGKADPTNGFKTPVSEYIKKWEDSIFHLQRTTMAKSNSRKDNPSAVRNQLLRLACIIVLTTFPIMTAYAADNEPASLH